MHLQLFLFHSSCWNYSNLVLNLSSICLFCSKQSVAEGFFFPMLFQEHKRICLLCFITLILPWFLGFKLYLALVLWWILHAVQSLCYNIKPPAQDCEGPVILLKKKKIFYLIGMGTGPLGLSCIVLNQNADSGSFESSLQNEASLWHIYHKQMYTWVADSKKQEKTRITDTLTKNRRAGL